MSNAIFKLSSAGGVTSETRYPNMLTNYGDFGALQRIGYYTNASDFNNIQFSFAATFQDLMVVLYHRGTASLTTTPTFIFLNSDGDQAKYSRTQLQGDGSSATSTRLSRSGGSYGVEALCPAANATANVYGTSVIHILNASNATTLKTALVRDAVDLNGSGFTWLRTTLFNSTAPITSLYFQSGSGNFKGGSSIAIYGVKASAA